MEINILSIKIKGIVDSIRDYTDEPVILSILDGLNKAINEYDYATVNYCLDEIHNWYQQNISAIQNNEYVFNKESHKKNISEIKNILSEMKKDSRYIKKSRSINIKEQDNCSKNYLEMILNNFGNVSRQLLVRHDNRTKFEIKDEYDVQDLLHSLLYIFFDDIRTEEWTPSYCGTCSRQDILIKNENIVIETKMTRAGLNNKKLSDELIIDIARYQTHPNCKTLYCFVYDPDKRINNPRGFEKDLTKKSDTIDVIILIRN